jgi:hypothetical protein
MYLFFLSLLLLLETSGNPKPVFFYLLDLSEVPKKNKTFPLRPQDTSFDILKSPDPLDWCFPPLPRSLETFSRSGTHSDLTILSLTLLH